MSNESLPPSLTRKPQREDRRLTDIERRRIETGVSVASILDPFPGFSTPGAAVVGMVAPPWEAELAHSYTSSLISARSAGSGICSFDLELNGSLVLTLSLLTGETRHAYLSVFSIVPGDVLSGIITAANGQVAVSIQLREAAQA